MDLTITPICSNTIDAVICIHVLEHIPVDYLAMQEIFRVLKPGGWALISVPIRLDQPTFEDPSITSPEARRQAFGETGHFRYYGFDLIDRLEGTGFQVQLNLNEDVNQNQKDKYGLLNDENIFFCTKP
jgi:predicted SAM-dependent methyltransferase